MTIIRRMGVTVILALVSPSAATGWGKPVVTWDFTSSPQGWQGNRYVADLTVTTEGLALRSTGSDPWLEGPLVNLPGKGATRVRIRMKSDADPQGELFYGRTFQAGHSVRFTIVDDRQWHEYLVLIREPLGLGTRFRLDPAASAGRITIGSIAVETLPEVSPPPFVRPESPDTQAGEPLSIGSAELAVEHHRRGWGDFTVDVNDEPMAVGYRTDLIGVVLGDGVQWLGLGEAQFSGAAWPEQLIEHAIVNDGGGAQWQMTRRFQKGQRPGTISVETTIMVSADRDVVYLPWLTLFPGLGSFGQRKTQGLFAGLEYLSDEPSSSEADITTPEHIRRAPDPVKITFPLMAIAHEDRHMGLVWESSANVAPVFDSPDRIYGSGAHVMALTAPAVGRDRFENDMAAHTPLRLTANEPLTVRATIIGGAGGTVVPAVQKYVELRGLPPVPTVAGGFDAAVHLLAHGWLDSAINEDGLIRHAVWGESFKAGPTGDAPVYMDWLANHAGDPNLAGRLLKGRDQAVSRWRQDRPYASMVSHTRTPTAPLVLGGIYPYVERRRTDAESLLAHFDEQGIREYRRGAVDYGKTHFANHANGHAAAEMVYLLEAATLSGDPVLIERGLALLDKQTVLYANTVPRGAQVWEIPLHTPDILASAYLVKAYTLGYVISRKLEHLEQARYWAWTGVPFVYLANPTEGAVGPYATIAVLGATNWRAPVWFGQPVQWCGLVYGSALYRLSEYDREGPWETIADGITAAGLQMTWPTSDEKRQGLLPDFFHLRAQTSDGPAINPGTVQTHVPELFDQGTLYDVKRLPDSGWFIHACCAIRALREGEGSLTFTVDGWDKKTHCVLISGVEQRPQAVTVRPTTSDARTQVDTDSDVAHFNAEQRLLVITLNEPAEIELRF